MLEKIVLEKTDNEYFRINVYHEKMIKVFKYKSNRIFIDIFQMLDNELEHIQYFPFDSKCLNKEVKDCFKDLVTDKVMGEVIKTINEIPSLLNNIILNIKIN